MPVYGCILFTMLYEYGITVTPLAALERDLAVAGCLHRRTTRRGIVNTTVGTPFFQNRVPAFFRKF